VTGLVAAARYLTIVPIPGAGPGRANAFGGTAVWFPVVGLGLGVVLAGVDRITGLIFPSLLAALLTVTAWKLVTGGLHLDGLADSLDGLAGRDPAQRLAIMRDSRIGAFGAMGLILVLLLFPPARSEGSGAAFTASVEWWAAPVALAIALAVTLGALQGLGALVFALSIACGVAVAWFIVTRVSGITGDVLGAAIEVGELAGLLTVSAWSHMAR
jgi:adenosylcobinamide-GDP ribazoletransferase